MIYPRNAARLFNTPLAVHRGKAAAILVGLGGRLVGNSIEFSGAMPLDHKAFANGRPIAGTLGDRLGRSQGPLAPYDMFQGVAIIPLEGTLVHKGAWLETESGETSYQGVQTQILRAERDPNVRGVAYEVDTYGGEVSGMFETAAMMSRLSQKKPTIAILSDCAYSAGYLLASTARQIIIPEQGGAGSIGIVAMHADFSKALDASGVKVTIFAAGKHKAELNPYEPVPEDVAAAVMAEIELVRVAFATAVSTYRGSRFSFDDAMATEAQCYSGTEAVTRGLADATGYPSDAFAAFVSELNRA